MMMLGDRYGAEQGVHHDVSADDAVSRVLADVAAPFAPARAPLQL